MILPNFPKNERNLEILAIGDALRGRPLRSTTEFLVIFYVVLCVELGSILTIVTITLALNISLYFEKEQKLSDAQNKSNPKKT